MSAEQIKVKSKSHFFSKKDTKVFSKSRKLERFVGHENSYLRVIFHFTDHEIYRLAGKAIFFTFSYVTALASQQSSLVLSQFTGNVLPSPKSEESVSPRFLATQ